MLGAPIHFTNLTPDTQFFDAKYQLSIYYLTSRLLFKISNQIIITISKLGSSYQTEMSCRCTECRHSISYAFFHYLIIPFSVIV